MLIKMDCANSGGGGVQSDLIWENDGTNFSPSAYVSVPNLSDYTYLIFEGIYSTSYPTHIGYAMWYKNGNQNDSVTLKLVTDETSRDIAVQPSNNRFQWGSTSANRSIPQKVYGIKDDFLNN